MWILKSLAVAAVAWLTAVMIIHEFPGSAVAVVLGWSIYLAAGLVAQGWVLIALALGVAAIWWTLTRPRGWD